MLIRCYHYIYIPYISPYHHIYLTFPSSLFFLIADLQGVAKDSDCDMHFQLCNGKEQSLTSPHCVALFHVKADVLQRLGNSWQFPTSVCWLGEAVSSKLTLCPDEKRCIPYRIWLVPSPCPECAVLFNVTPVLPMELWVMGRVASSVAARGCHGTAHGARAHVCMPAGFIPEVSKGLSFSAVGEDFPL